MKCKFKIKIIKETSKGKDFYCIDMDDSVNNDCFILDKFFANYFKIDWNFLKPQIRLYNGKFKKFTITYGMFNELVQCYVFPTKKDANEFKKEVLDPIIVAIILSEK